MTTAATISAELILDAGKFSGGMKDAQGSIDSFEQRMKNLGKSMTQIGAGMTLALTVPIVAFGKAAVNSALEAEMALTELETVIKSTGGAAGLTAEELAKVADDLQGITMFGDEEIMRGQAMLLTFTKIGKDVFPDATMAMLNMAQKFGSVDEAAIQLGKALNDPVAGVGALRRVGVSLSEQQEQQIKDFMAVGDIASAQGIILEELAVEFGGLAEAAGGTAAGQMAIFNNKLDTMKETLGAAIIPALIRFMDALTPIIEAIASAPPWVQNMIVSLLALVALAGPLVSFFGMMSSFIGWVAGLGPVLAGIGTAFAGIGAVITGTLIPAIVAALPVLALIAAAIALVYLVWKNWDTLKVTLEQLWFIIKWGFGQAMQGVKDGIGKTMATVKAKVAPVIEWFKRAWMTVKTVFNLVFGGINAIAIRVFQAIIRGIMAVVNAIAKLKSAFANLKLPKALTPGSPTPFEIGLMGINRQMGLLANQSLPKLQTGFGNLAPAGVTQVGAGGNTSIVDNRRFEAGVTADVLRMAMREQVQGLTSAVKGKR